MLIAELIWPGSWIDHPNRDESFELDGLLHLLDGNLAEANVALLLFEQARSQGFEPPSMEDWQRDADERRWVVERLEAQLPAMSPEERWEASERIRFDADVEVARNRWAQGETPRACWRR